MKVSGVGHGWCSRGGRSRRPGGADTPADDPVRIAGAQTWREPAVVDGGDPVKARSRRSGIAAPERSRTCSEFYRAVPHRQHASRAQGSAFAGERGRGQRPGVSSGAELGAPVGHAAANTSPRRASITASDRVDALGASSPHRAPATAASRPRPAGIRGRRASARAVAIPIRRPVNVPGPTPTAIRSMSVQPEPAASSSSAISGSSVAGVAGRVPGGGSSRRLERPPLGPVDSATVGRRGWRCRSARILTATARPIAPVAAGVLEPDARRDPAERGDLAPRRCGHSTNAIVSGAEVVGEQVGILAGEVGDPEQVEVRRPAPAPGSAGRS